MPISHECACGLVTPVPDAQAGRRVRCRGCGTVAVASPPSPTPPAPTPPPAAAEPKPDLVPLQVSPPPPRARRVSQAVADAHMRANYPRTGGVIDWRQLSDDQHPDDRQWRPRRPPPPDPQTRYLKPELHLTGRIGSLVGGGVLLAVVGIWLFVALTAFDGLPFIPLAVGVGILVVGFGVIVRGVFGRRY